MQSAKARVGTSTPQKSSSPTSPDEQPFEQEEKLPPFWRAYEAKMHGGVPSLTEHFVDRGTSTADTFVSNVVEQLLAG